ncbi:MAG TPA: hypothetical protein VEB43_15855, partial [Anaeromyxobacter sp.]|nr:hypothetical protein [Anaeromyxobacter sp.]
MPWRTTLSSSPFTASLLFWYVGLLPDLAALRDSSKSRTARVVYGIFSLGWRGSARHWRHYRIAYLLLAGLATPLVLSDPRVLATLPERELRNGLAEVVKHGVIADPDLFALCERGWEAVTGDLERVVRQGMAVKARVIVEDPYERGLRQALNLGHTIGHGV